MMTKHDEIYNADSTLNKCHPDEPIFILRASDILAPIVVKYWATIAQDTGVNSEKVKEAWLVSEAMKKWSNRKIPD